ncbi:lysosomal cholesterol signaling protein-like isoform X2 [Bemisia tabaci]|uniref:lysosomal cholesterol signaling protein isoform X2 n=1 Tax=Bemisia tabaci TaxID=7038 RepID=UPI0008F9DDDA|nr:PREDICTED: integral membrane protein GPR155 isoform X2 [Bemisia tabaci]
MSCDGNEGVDIQDFQDLHDEGSFANLYPALTQCFAIITCGYVAGRLQLVTPKETAGLSVFVGTFSLPSLIFLSLAELDLKAVNWYFPLAIFLSKALVFFAVILITIFITKPSSLARAGIYAIFATQSNDFAIGKPIVEALYNKSHREFVSYLYLVAPTSLIMLNPIGFILIGISKLAEAASDESSTLPKMVWNVVKGILSNPVVFMSSLGVLGNIVFDHQPPVVVKTILDVFGQAFSATALFLLGLRMVGKVQKLQGAALLTPVLLIAVKLIAMPIVTREVVSVTVRYGDSNSTLAPALSTFGFLYGTIPAAPAVFVYATQYGLDTDVIAAAMVLCTFISAPLMFASAKMIAATEQPSDNFIDALSNFEFDTSIIGFIACLWVLTVFLVGKDFWKLPVRVTALLIVPEMISCIGVILGHLIPSKQMLRFFLTTIGNLSTDLLTAALCATILCIQAQKFSVLLKGEMLVLGFCLGFPILAVSVLMYLVMPSPVHTEYDFNFMYGSPEAVLYLLVLLVSFIGSVCFLTLGQRLRIRNAHFLALVSEANGMTAHDRISNLAENGLSSTSVNSNESSATESLLDSPATPRESRDKLMPHIIFVILIACGIFVKLGLMLWRLILDEMTGVYVEIAFFAITLSRGKGIIAFFLFGIDSATVFKPMCRRILTLWYGGESFELPSLDSLSLETRTACDQFRSQHLESCKKDIAKDLRDVNAGPPCTHFLSMM